MKVSSSKFKVSSRRAFTLIELLVVVMILLILAAIILPVLSNSRMKGVRVECLSNIRQVGLLLLMYGHENNDRLPQSVTQYPNPLVLPQPLVDMAVRGGIPNRVFYDPGYVEAAKAGQLWQPQDVSEGWFKGGGSGRTIGYCLTLPGIPGLLPGNENRTIVPQPVQFSLFMLPTPVASERVLVAGVTMTYSKDGSVRKDSGALVSHMDSKGYFPLGDNIAMLDGSARWRKFKDMKARTVDPENPQQAQYWSWFWW